MILIGVSLYDWFNVGRIWNTWWYTYACKRRLIETFAYFFMFLMILLVFTCFAQSCSCVVADRSTYFNSDLTETVTLIYISKKTKALTLVFSLYLNYSVAN